MEREERKGTKKKMEVRQRNREAEASECESIGERD
jgi:hypothetical protein